MGQEESHSEEMDLAQIQDLCIIFMKECPSGSLHLHELKRIFGVPSSSAEESLYVETVFRSFDSNQDNTLDFLEYVAALHLILGGISRIDSSGHSRCMTKTATASWTGRR
ncbi:hypothetical protein INR49_004500 [Caranx melampygus]|nr:hypothetical protein INR49_004500 [Caranx melampygus]